MSKYLIIATPTSQDLPEGYNPDAATLRAYKAGIEEATNRGLLSGSWFLTNNNGYAYILNTDENATVEEALANDPLNSISSYQVIPVKNAVDALEEAAVALES
jgi:hypothetical protein